MGCCILNKNRKFTQRFIQVIFHYLSNCDFALVDRFNDFLRMLLIDSDTNRLTIYHSLLLFNLSSSNNPYAVPRMDLTVPANVFAKDLLSPSMTFAIFLIYSRERSPVCLTKEKK